MTSSLLAYYYRIRFILKRGAMVCKSRAVICLKMQANSSSAEVCIKLKARVHDLQNRLGLLDVTPSKTEKHVHVYGIVSRETRDSTNINFTIARRHGAIVDLHVDTVHVYSICASEIADFAPKNSSDLHLSRGPPRRRRGVLEPPQPPPWVHAWGYLD